MKFYIPKTVELTGVTCDIAINKIVLTNGTLQNKTKMTQEQYYFPQLLLQKIIGHSHMHHSASTLTVKATRILHN